MDLISLRYFITTARLEHMTQAALRLNITQPTLSASIRRLEAEVGCPLFDRQGRSIRLNEDGRQFLRAAVQAEETLSASMAAIRERHTAEQNQIRLNCSVSPVNSMLVDALLAKQYPLHIDTIPADWEQALLSRKSNLVITLGTTQDRAIESRALHTFRIVVACGRRHPLAGSEALNVGNLAAYPFCTTGTSHGIYNMVREQAEQQGLYPYNVTIGRNSADMIRALHTGAYLCLMVERNLPVSDDLVILPVEGLHITVPINLHWLRADAGSLRLAAVRNDIIDFFSGMPEEK